MNRMNATLWLLALLFITSCQTKETASPTLQEPYFVPAWDAMNDLENHKLELSQLCESEETEWIALETSDEVMLKGNEPVYLLDDKLLVIGEKVYHFDRKTGKYLAAFGKQGKGPDEYRFIEGSSYDAKRGTVLARCGSSNFTYYQMDVNTGKVVKRIKPQDNLQYSFYEDFIQFNDSTWFGGVANLLGKSEYRMLSFEPDSFKVKKKFEQPLSFKMDMTRISIMMSKNNFFRCNNNLYYLENYTDTIFQVTENELKPHAIFQYDEKGAPYTHRYEEGYKEPYWVNSIRETKNFIQFSFVQNKTDKDNSKQGYGVYNKATGTCTVSLTKESDSEIGIPNDIDNAFPVVPSSLSDKGQLLSSQLALNAVVWKESYPEKYQKLSAKKKAILDNLKEDDNPVVVIAKVRES